MTFIIITSTYRCCWKPNLVLLLQLLLRFLEVQLLLGVVPRTAVLVARWQFHQRPWPWIGAPL